MRSTRRFEPLDVPTPVDKLAGISALQGTIAICRHRRAKLLLLFVRGPASSSLEKERRASLFSASFLFFSLLCLLLACHFSFQLIYPLLHLPPDSPRCPRLMSQLHFAFVCKGYTAITTTTTTIYLSSWRRFARREQSQAPQHPASPKPFTHSLALVNPRSRISRSSYKPPASPPSFARQSAIKARSGISCMFGAAASRTRG